MNRRMQYRVCGLMGAVALSPLLGSGACAQETPQTASRFCDSIGVNTLIGNYVNTSNPPSGVNLNNAYNTNSNGVAYTAQDFYNKVQIPLAWLGVHHIRDYMYVDDQGFQPDPNNPQPNPGYAANHGGYTAANYTGNEEDYYKRLQRLGNQGVKCDLVIQPVGWAFGDGDNPYDMVAQSWIITNTFLSGCQETVEGANEWDYFGPTNTWHQSLNQETSDIWSKYRGRSSTAGMQIYSGTIINLQYLNNMNVELPDTHDYVNGNPSRNIPMYGNVLGKVDYGNAHLYGASQLPNNDPDDQMPILYAGRKELWDSAPFVITETGYYTGTATYSVSDIVQEKYTLRTLLTAFNMGAYRTYLFQLYDHHDNPADMDSNFGLIKYDGTNKPSYNALESLIWLLSDPSTSTTVTPLTWSLGGSTANVKHTLLQKSDGSYYLALWLGVTSTDSTQSQAVTVTVPSTIGAATLNSINNYGSMGQSSLPITNGTMSLNVTDTVSILKLTGPIVESTPLALSQNSVSCNGGQVTATVTFKNVSSVAMTILPYIGARDASGNNVDFGPDQNNPYDNNVTLQPGDTATVTAPKTLTTGMNTGTWRVFGTYRTYPDNYWYSISPDVSLTVTN